MPEILTLPLTDSNEVVGIRVPSTNSTQTVGLPSYGISTGTSPVGSMVSKRASGTAFGPSVVWNFNSCGPISVSADDGFAVERDGLPGRIGRGQQPSREQNRW
ncbi:MAG: hypothetical protein QM811_15080 [Pirellulales bacterium]